MPISTNSSVNSGSDSSPALSPITQRYLLVTFCIPFYIDSQGRRYLDHLWVKDLLEHLVYLKHFTLASPCKRKAPPQDAIPLDHEPAFAEVQFIDLPDPTGMVDALKKLPLTIKKLWNALGQADIVHTGVAGWPIPEGWLLTPMVYLRRKFYILIIESAFWRSVPGVAEPLKKRIRASITETLNRWCIGSANLSIFTQEQYRQSLLPKKSTRGHVIHASWIDERVIMADRTAKEMWEQKLLPNSEGLSLLFAGRLTTYKGVRVLLAAMRLLSAEGIAIKLDILGQGDLLEECELASHEMTLPTQIRVLGTVSYGQEFFNLLQRYTAIIIPTISDEQPRIVYDAYSQAIPVLATTTDGLRDCVWDGKTGKLFTPNNPEALVEVLKWSLNNMNQLAAMGLESLHVAREHTHQEMHRKRWQLIQTAVSKYNCKRRR